VAPSAREPKKSELRARPGVAQAIRREQRRLGFKLQALRQECGLTQEAAAEAIGISDRQLRRIELAQTNATVGILVSCALTYKVELVDLFRGKD
jgi:DNA-binding XRE family transcriptional regulator